MASDLAIAKRATDRINILNMVLMLISALAAFLWPFYLFLIAYAVLGPLHYLTEISWLHDRRYFTSRKRDYLFLVVATLIYAGSLVPHFALPQLVANAVIIAFCASIALVLTQDLRWRWLVAVAGTILLFAIPITFSVVVTSLLLVTVIHVFFFTGCFIFYGSLKSASLTGYASGVLFLALAMVMFIVTPMPGGGIADAFVVQHYDKAFGDLNIWFLRTFHLSTAGASASDPFEFSPGATAVMRFIAYAYLYHYLNWFSKTKIIRWHEVSKARLGSVVGLWILAVALYAFDYDIGLKALFFLSALHVVLEFPLDLRTLIGIGSELTKRIRPRELSAGKTSN